MNLLERINKWHPHQQRALALLVLIVSMVSLWWVVIEPVAWLLVSQDEWREDTRRSLAQARGRAGSEPALRKQVADLSRAPIWAAFFDVPPGQDASTFVQRDLMVIGAHAGVTLQAAIVLPRVEEVGLSGYGIRFTAAMSADQLRKFVGALHANSRYLRVERLGITAPQSQRPDENPPLAVTMEVFGYIRGGEFRDSPSTADRPGSTL